MVTVAPLATVIDGNLVIIINAVSGEICVDVLVVAGILVVLLAQNLILQNVVG